MNVLIIGGGGREHALAWQVASSPRVDHVFVAPGNAGTAHDDKLINVPIGAESIDKLVAFAMDNAIDLTIVGPEAPLVLGVVDQFQANGLKIFGPSAKAAQLEGSKAFSKDFLARHNIPTASYETFTDIEPAKAYVEKQGCPIVIKADGLAAGKGVIIAQKPEEAFAAIDDMLAGNKFGDAGSRVVIESFLVGEEASYIVMVDGKNILPFATSQDHKARDNGDKGPNTGGMGAYSPAPVVTPEIDAWVMQHIMQPTVDGMEADGAPYVGFLYAGLMIDEQGKAKVLEFNCRFGDPETQPIMMRLQSDLTTLCFAALDGKLDQTPIKFDERAAVGVVLAAGGYPEAYNKGDLISGLDADEHNDDMKIFHAGTQAINGGVETNGGRVLCATALGNTVTLAQQKAYELVHKIHWENVYFRTDIAYRAINREQSK